MRMNGAVTQGKSTARITGSTSAKRSQKDLVILEKLLEAGKVVPVIDKRFLLHDAAEALRYLGAGHARGKVVITMEDWV